MNRAKRPQRPGELVGLAEMAILFDIGKTAISNWTARKKDFPKPWGTWAMGSLWVKADVLAWFRDHQAAMIERNQRQAERLEAELDMNRKEAKRLGIK